MDIEKLAGQPCVWSRARACESDVVVSSTVRLSRNLDGFSFVGHATPSDLQCVVEKVVGAALALPEGFEALELDNLTSDDATLLIERRLASFRFINSDVPRALLLPRDEEFCVAVNDEDHVRLSATNAGFALRDAWTRLSALDDALAERLDYSFDHEFGYLTSCPSNVGTGLRASVIAHIPGLIETNHARKVMRSLEKLNLTARGCFGDGIDSLGDLFEIGTQATLGSTEDELIETLRGVVASVVAYERKAREEIMEKNRIGIDDRCSRSVAAMLSAREMPFQEAITHLSNLRFGVSLGLNNIVQTWEVDQLMVDVQTSHLNRLAESDKLAYPSIEEDELRALYLRRKLTE